jgi:hypothetical protein
MQSEVGCRSDASNRKYGRASAGFLAGFSAEFGLAGARADGCEPLRLTSMSPPGVAAEARTNESVRAANAVRSRATAAPEIVPDENLGFERWAFGQPTMRCDAERVSQISNEHLQKDKVRGSE